MSTVELPRVTEIIKAVGLTRPYPDTPAMDLARRRGQALHRAIEYHAAGMLDEASLHPDIRPGFDAYLEFCETYHHEPLYSELAVEDTYLGYRGHLDRVGSVNGETAILDWKWVSPDAFGATLQLAAYDLLWSKIQLGPPAARHLFVALGTGTPKVHDVARDLINAKNTFKAALIVYRAQREAGR